MAHNHSHHHDTGKGITTAFWLNLLFAIIEIIGGIITNSTAIIADAFHDFMDAIAIGLAVFLEKKAGKKRTAKFSYGYRRFSLLSALGLSVFLLTGAVIMCIGAYNSFVNPHVVNSRGMLLLAILGIAINGFAFLRVKKSQQHNHDGILHHEHKNMHPHEHNHNSKAIMLHLLEDVLGWVAVLVGAAIIYFTNWYWIDGILAIAIALFIGFNAIKNLIATMKIMLQSVPDNIDIKQLTSELTAIDGVEDIHDFHVWSMDGHYHIASLHAVIDPGIKPDKDIRKDIAQLLSQHKILHPTIQLETTNDCGLENC